MAASGAAALTAMLFTAQKSEAGLLFGFSLARLAIFGLTAAGTLALAICAAAVWRRPAWWRRLSTAAGRFFASPARLFGLVLALFSLFLIVAAFLILAVSPAAAERVILSSLVERAGPLLIWLELVILLAGVLIWLHLRGSPAAEPFFTPLRLAVLLAVATVVYAAALRFFAATTWDIRFARMERYIFLPAALGLIWGLLARFYAQADWYQNARRIFLLAGIGVVSFVLYSHTSQWMDWQGTPSKAYWHLLADAFLHGRLYLLNPPTTHDLTFHNGQWYVPNPPLPGLIMLPLVALQGVDGVSSVTFSIVCGALSVLLVYLILERASRLELIPTGQTANLWLTTMFAFGTCYWWLAVMGRMWFISQQITLLFAALALYAALRKLPPWLVGFGLGLAVLSRPNVFTLWPFLLGLTLFFEQRESGAVDWKRAILWAVQSGAPVVLAAGGLLYYNYIRFGDWLDFGYVGITSADWLTEAVRNYGMFNIHFLGANLHAMFLKLPVISCQNGCLTISPTREGISMFAMTPALLYLLRRSRWNWWTAGAWLSVLLTAGLLLLYHNTGAWQLGYRYLMDFILPLLLLLAVAVGKRPSWIFKGLVLVSVAGNFLGILWWFNRWWC